MLNLSLLSVCLLSNSSLSGCAHFVVSVNCVCPFLPSPHNHTNLLNVFIKSFLSWLEILKMLTICCYFQLMTVYTALANGWKSLPVHPVTVTQNVFMFFSQQTTCSTKKLRKEYYTYFSLFQAWCTVSDTLASCD